MLLPRLTPCLLIHNGGLVKTIAFREPKYVGDPLNAVRIFNEKGVDELLILDIDASAQEREPSYDLISNLANESRMPVCYGGGIASSTQAERIIRLGVEKVAIGAAAIQRPDLIEDCAHRVGAQSIVAVLNVRSFGARRYEVVAGNGTVRTGQNPVEAARVMEDSGAGEILINSVDRDGTGTGYDLELAGRIHRSVSVPMSVLGGAGSLSHVEDLYKACGLIGAVAGSLFVFKGKYRAVLINYPAETERRALLARSGFDA